MPKKKRPTKPATSEMSKDEIDSLADEVERLVDEELGDDASFEEYEKAVMRITNEVARRRLQDKLQKLSDGYGPVLRIDHNNDWHGWREGTAFEYRQHLPGEVAYHSLVGSLWVRRFTYRENMRNGATYVPLELDAGLMEKMTPAMAKAVALGTAQLPARQLHELLTVAGRCPPSYSTVSRSGRDLGAYALAANDEIEPLVREAETVPEHAIAVVVGLDRTSVLMRKNGQFLSIFSGFRDLRRSRPRQTSGPVDGVEWRLDYVGTVYFADAEGERIEGRQYRLPSDHDPEELVERMLADVRHAKASRPQLRVVLIQDGAPELWSVMRTALSNEPSVRKWDEALDWYHLDERLSECTKLFRTAESSREALRQRWHELFFEKADGAERVLRSLAQHAKRLSKPDREIVDEHIAYLRKRRDLTRYRRLRRRGLPIGSGVTEAACKSLIGVRAKRGGQHWTQRGLSAALHLRSIAESGRFDSFWTHFSNRYRADSIVATH